MQYLNNYCVAMQYKMYVIKATKIGLTEHHKELRIS